MSIRVWLIKKEKERERERENEETTLVCGLHEGTPVCVRMEGRRAREALAPPVFWSSLYQCLHNAAASTLLQLYSPLGKSHSLLSHHVNVTTLLCRVSVGMEVAPSKILQRRWREKRKEGMRRTERCKGTR